MRYEDASHAGSFAQGSDPVARDDTDALPAGARGPATGNLITGEGTQTGTAGADTAAGAQITAIAGAGGEDASFAGGKLQVGGQFGNLAVEADGTFSYLANAGTPENSRDRFSYTLADQQGNSDTAYLTVEIGKTPAVIKANAQQVVPGPDGVVTLPPGVELSDVRIVGRNLVIDLPDGSQMVIVDGAVFVPQLVLDGVEVPATNLAALLIGSEPQPAAGTPPPSSGGNFAVPPPPLDPGVPLGDLIPPTEYSYRPPEPQEVLLPEDRDPEVFIQPRDGVPVENAVDLVNEAGLPARPVNEPAGSNAASTSETTTGFIVYESPDDPNTITVDGLGLGGPVTIIGVGQTIAGAFGTLTITSIADGRIGYSYTLIDNTTGDNTHDDFIVTLVDGDGDIDVATLVINIIDDVPTARPDTDFVPAGSLTATGNVMTDLAAGDIGDTDTNAADTVGADNARVSFIDSVNAAPGAGVPEGGSVNIAGQFGTLQIFSNGDYTYVRSLNAPGGAIDTFNYTLLDGDGDTSAATLTITLSDSQPTIRSLLIQLDDDTLPGGLIGGPGDGPDAFNAAGGFSSLVSGGDGPLTFTVQLTGAPEGFAFVSGGTGVVLLQQNGVTVRTITYDPVTGTYDVTQNARILHPEGGEENDLTFVLTLTATDQDGDTASGSITIVLNDDTPVVTVQLNQEGAVTVDESGPAGVSTIEFTGDEGDDADVAGSGPIGRAVGTTSVIGGSALFGADGPLAGASLTYKLQLGGTDTPLTLTDGSAIQLQLIDGVVVGIVTEGVHAGEAAFAIAIAPGTGIATVELYLSLDHPDASNPNDLLPLGPNTVSAVLTATDADGDSRDSDAIDISALFNFLDDGPAVSGTVNAEGAVTVDESGPTAASTIEFTGDEGDDLDVDGSGPIGRAVGSSAVVNAAALFGADGEGAPTDVGYALALGSTDTSLTLTDGSAIQLQLIDGVVVGIVQEGAHAGEAAFAIAIDSGTGVATVELYLSLDHPDTSNSNDSLPLGPNTVSVVVTATDGDGDSANSGPIDISGLFNFLDDGPTAAGVVNGQGTVVVDESGPTGPSTIEFTGDEGDDLDVVGSGPIGRAVGGTSVVNPSVLYGADGPLGEDVSYTLALGSTDTALTLTDGSAIQLQLIDGVVVGMVTEGAHAGEAAFAISVNSASGIATVELYLSLDHPDQANPDDSLPLGPNTVSVIVSAIDGDGDSDASAPIDISGLFSFRDDGPTAVDDGNSVAEGDSVGGNVLPNDLHGADGYDGAVVGGVAGTNDATDTVNMVGGVIVIPGTWGNLTLNADGSYTYQANANSNPPPGTVDAFVYTIRDGDGDLDSATLSISVQDVTVVATDSEALVYEEGLPVTGSDSAANSETFNGQIVASGGSGTGFVYTLTSPADGTFGTLTINADGSYTYVLDTPFNTLPEGNDGVTTEVGESFNYTVTDSDGNSTTGTIVVSIVDDVPTIDVVGPNTVVEGTPVNGTWSQVIGADQPGATTVVVFGGTEYALGAAIATGKGTLTVAADGTWTFVANNNLNNNLPQSIDFTVRVTDADGDVAQDLQTVAITDGPPPTGGAVLDLEVDDDALSDGNNAASPDEVDSGTLSFTAGSDALTSFVFGGTGSLDPSLTWTRVSDVLIEGRDGATLVVTLALSAPASIAPGASGNVTVTATLVNNYDSHPVFTADDLKDLGSVTVVATDIDGDFATGTVNLDVSDDVPTLSVSGPVTVVEGTSTVGGTWSQSIGADQPGATTVVVFGGTEFALNTPIATGKGTLTVNANGTWTFAANNNLDHDDPQSISFTVKVTDADGDVAQDLQTVAITDGPPPTGGAVLDLEVDDDALSDGNNAASPDEVDSGTLSFTAGSDALTSFVFGGTGSLDPSLTWTRVSDVLIEGRDGATLVVTLALSAPASIAPGASGNVTVTATLVNNYDSHPVFTADDLKDLGSVTVVATDIDGDFATGTVNLDVSDDVPTLSVSGPVTVVEGTSTVGGTWSQSIGADQPGATTVVVFGGTEFALNTPIATGKGTLTVNANGTWTFAANNNLDHDDPQSISFTVKVTDADGDVAQDLQTVAITDGPPPTGGAVLDLEVDDDALSDGNNAASPDEVDSGTLSFTAGSDALTSFVFGGTGSLDPSLTWTRVSDVLIEGRDGATLVVTLALSAPASIAPGASGNVTVTATLVNNYDSHPVFTADDLKDLGSVTVVATDIDGDFATGTVNLDVSDDVPVITLVTNPLLVENDATPTATGDFEFSIGADKNGDFDDIFVDNFTVSVDGVPLDSSDFTFTEGAETASTATYNFTFDYESGPGMPATATGTLVFNKLDGEYTVSLTNGPLQGFSILQTAAGTLFQGYQLGSTATDNSQPDISVTQIQGTPGDPDPTDLFVQFTAVAEPSSGTGANNLRTIDWDPDPDAPNPSPELPAPGTWTTGELFNQAGQWVSTSNSENGVGGDTIQGGEVLDFTLVQGTNPKGILAQPETFGQATDMFLKFDGIGEAEDMIVILKLYDPVADVYTTRAVMITNSDIQKGPGTGPGIYSGITLDNNDGLVIIEQNDYALPGENWVIVGAQIAGSDEDVVGTAINLNSAIGPGGDSDTNNDGAFETQLFEADVNNGPFKISSIGFTTTNTNEQSAELSFDVTVTDADGDQDTTSVTVNIGEAVAPLALTMAPSDLENMRQTSSSTSNISLAAAVAAAGLVEMQAAAKAPEGDDSTLSGDTTTVSLSNQVVEKITLDDSDDSADALSGATQDTAADKGKPADTGNGHSDKPADDHSLDDAGSKDHGKSDASNDNAADQGPAQTEAANLVAPDVGMPSAEALHAAGLEGTAKHGGNVEKILVDALGSHHGPPTVDGLLDAFGGGNGGLEAIAGLATTHGGDVPAWDTSAGGAFAQIADMMIKMDAQMHHHDAVQPVANG